VQAVGIVTHEDGFSPLPDGIAARLAQVDGVAGVPRVRFETGRIAGRRRADAGVAGREHPGLRERARPRRRRRRALHHAARRGEGDVVGVPGAGADRGGDHRLAALAGVLAAIPPARRAARVDVLRAVTTE
jgi:hypothetical protein